MGTIVEFQLLVLDSLRYSSKTESPINRSAEAVICRSLVFIYLLSFLFLFFLNSLFYFSYEQETSVCVYVLQVTIKQKMQSLFDKFLYSCNS